MHFGFTMPDPITTLLQQIGLAARAPDTEDIDRRLRSPSGILGEGRGQRAGGGLQQELLDAIQSGDEGLARRIRQVADFRRLERTGAPVEALESFILSDPDEQQQVMSDLIEAERASPDVEQAPPRFRRAGGGGFEFILFPELDEALQGASIQDLVLGGRLA